MSTNCEDDTGDENERELWMDMAGSKEDRQEMKKGKETAEERMARKNKERGETEEERRERKEREKRERKAKRKRGKVEEGGVEGERGRTKKKKKKEGDDRRHGEKWERGGEKADKKENRVKGQDAQRQGVERGERVEVLKEQNQKNKVAVPLGKIKQEKETREREDNVLKVAESGEFSDQQSRGEETSKLGKSVSSEEERKSKSEGFVSMNENKLDVITRLKNEDGCSDSDMSHSTCLHQVRKKKGLKKSPKEQVDSANNIKDESDDDVPLVKRKGHRKRKVKSEDDEDFEKKPKKKRREQMTEEKRSEVKEPLEKTKGKKKKLSPEEEKKEAEKAAKEAERAAKKEEKRRKEEEEEKTVWKWWTEEEKHPEGIKWRTLEHKGPLFASEYEPLPDHVRFRYDGKVFPLSTATEEAATFYAVLLEHDYSTREIFNKNFFGDWRKRMTLEEREIIRDFSKCDFTNIHDYLKQQAQIRKDRSKEEKAAEKDRLAIVQDEYGFCMMDGHKQKVANFRTEPPGLFRGRGAHPKQGKIKSRIEPEDIIINCSKGSEVPKPPPGHRWKTVVHDNTVSWLASWTENIMGGIKYVMLGSNSRLKGEKDWEKYELARKLKYKISSIRSGYMADMRNKKMAERQRAVALYFIDTLALRAGNEKDSEEEADTVGCCSLRVEHITLHRHLGKKECVVEFDFLGKDSMRYENVVEVNKKVFKNLGIFMENKEGGDQLFDRLDTGILNVYLKKLMPGLSAKVFRTFNASTTLEAELQRLTDPEASQHELIHTYKMANKAVAELCNHKKTVSKNHGQAMDNAQNKALAYKTKVKVLEKELFEIRHGKLKPKLEVKTEDELEEKTEPELKVKAELEVKSEEEDQVKFSLERADIKEEPKVKEEISNDTVKEEGEMVKVIQNLKKTNKSGLKERVEKRLEKRLENARVAMEKAESDAALKEEMKEIALGTSKLNYLDPRITVQWCKTHKVPLEKLFNKTERLKFRWAIDMLGDSEEPFKF